MRAILFVFVFSLIISCSQSKFEPIEMEADVAILAADDMMGRETGTEGERKAADYIAKRFQDMNLKPLGTDGYFQDFSFKPSTNPHEQAALSDTLDNGMLQGRNVVAMLDKAGAHTVVIGAHYDHLGMGGAGSLYRGEEAAIHNGADDNASGVALMLNLAQRLLVQQTNNNYIFIAFSGEEMGLLGSGYWAKNPTIDASKLNFMINMDMVGRLNEEKALAVHGIGTSPLFKQTVFANNEAGFRIAEHESGVGPSDHTSFYLIDVPVLHFFTGQHDDYHKPSDDADKVNTEGMKLISDYLISILMDLDDEGKLAFKKTKDESEEVPRFKVGLGVVPDYLFSGEGMRIDGVSEDKPAQKAGLFKGDIVKKMDTTQITDMMSYMKALSKYEKGQKTTVTIDRDGELMEFEIEF